MSDQASAAAIWIVAGQSDRAGSWAREPGLALATATPTIDRLDPSLKAVVEYLVMARWRAARPMR